MHFLADEKEQTDKCGTNSSKCSCLITVTYGLPCACSIAKKKRLNIPIGLDEIHTHWKGLRFEGDDVPKENQEDISLLPEWDLLQIQFNNTDYNMKVHMKERFHQFVLPETTSMRPPPRKVSTKETPKKDKHTVWSTKRSPSLWEHVDSHIPDSQDSQTASTLASRKSACTTNASPNQRTLVSRNPPTLVEVHIPHKDQILTFMHQFIARVEDVAGDGHCEFRASFRGMSVDDYQIIRYDLLKGAQKDRYARSIGTTNRWNDVKGTLTGATMAIAPPDKWMTMTYMGFLIAQRYWTTVVLLFIHKGQSKMFFPLCGATTHKDRIICLDFVNNNHFMKVFLKDGSLIPPTSVLWARHCHEDERTWDTRYVERMVVYNALCRGAGYEVIGDDADLYLVENIAESQSKIQSQGIGLDDLYFGTW